MKINLFKPNIVGLLCAAVFLANIVSGYSAETNAGAQKPASPAPNPNTDAEKAATSAAQTWLTVIDNGNYAQSWQNASALFQGAVTEEKWKTALEAVRKPLGNLVSRKLKSAQHMTEMPGAPAGQYVVMQFDTSFTGKKPAVETVTFMFEKDGQWRAAGYFIN